MIPPSPLVISSGMGLIDLPLRASSQSPISFSGAAWSILDCAPRTSTFRSCAFREQEDDQAAHPILLKLKPRVARTQRINRPPVHPIPTAFPAQETSLCNRHGWLG